MSAEEITLAVVETLEALSVPYMLVGSFSSNLYGIPRSTQDADFVVQLESVSISSVRSKRSCGKRKQNDGRSLARLPTGSGN